MTASVKDELSRLSVTKTCDRRAEISALLGMSEASARQRVSRAVRQLRRTWMRQAPEGVMPHDA